MRYIILFILFTVLLTCIIFGQDIIKSSLYYLENPPENIYNLSQKVFNKQILENESADVSTNNIAICIKFDDPEFDFFELSLKINGIRLTNLMDRGYYNLDNNMYMINITEHLRPVGDNIIVASYSKVDKRDVKEWHFYIESADESLSKAEAVQITHGPGWKHKMAPSPNANLIAFVQEDETKIFQIKIMNLDTDKEFTVISNQKLRQDKGFGSARGKKIFYSTSPSWSDDGKYLYFSSSKSGYYEIYRSKISENGYPEPPLQLTNYRCYTSGPVVSPKGDLAFVSNKSGNLEIYLVKDVKRTNNGAEFEKNVKQLTDNITSDYASSWSADGNYLSFTHEGRKTNNIQEYSSIYIYDLNKRKIVRKIQAQKDQDNFCSIWSPTALKLAFYCGKSLYLYDFDSDDPPSQLAYNVRRPTFIMFPTWSPRGDEIYYVHGDDPYYIMRVKVDEKTGYRKEEFINETRDNSEIVFSYDSSFLLYTSFDSGNWEIWKKVQGKGFKSFISFQAPPETKIYYLCGDKKKFIGLQPELLVDNTFFEMENVHIGYQKVQFGEGKASKITEKVSNPFDVTNFSLPEAKRPLDIRNAVRSIFWPGSGQKRKNWYGKKKLFGWSNLLLLSAIGGSYYLEDYYYDKYEKSKTSLEMAENRHKSYRFYYVRWSLTGMAIGNWLLNVTDALISKNKLSEDENNQIEKIRDTYRQRTKKTRQIADKKWNDATTGELKIFCDQKNTDIYLAKGGEKNLYGKTGLTADENTFFTISYLPEGMYKIIAEKKYYKPYSSNVIINPNKVTYENIYLQKDFKENLKKLSLSLIPGYRQYYEQDRKAKAYLIAGLEIACLIGAGYCHLKAEDEYDRYKDASDDAVMMNAREHTLKYDDMRDTFLIGFGLGYLYHLYDLRID